MKHLSAADRKTLVEQLQAMKRGVLDEIRSTSADVENNLQPASHEVQSHVDEAEVESIGEVRFAAI